MDQLTKEDLRDVVRKVLDERNDMGGQGHDNDHEFIQMLKDREERRFKRVEKFKMSFIGGIALSLLGALIWVGKWAMVHIHVGN